MPFWIRFKEFCGKPACPPACCRAGDLPKGSLPVRYSTEYKRCVPIIHDFYRKFNRNIWKEIFRNLKNSPPIVRKFSHTLKLFCPDGRRKTERCIKKGFCRHNDGRKRNVTFGKEDFR